MIDYTDPNADTDPLTGQPKNKKQPTGFQSLQIPGAQPSQAVTPTPAPVYLPPATLPENPANPGLPMSPTAPANPQQPGGGAPLAPGSTSPNYGVSPGTTSVQDAASKLFGQGLRGKNLTDALRAAGYQDNGLYYDNGTGYGFSHFVMLNDGTIEQRDERGGGGGDTGSGFGTLATPPLGAVGGGLSSVGSSSAGGSSSVGATGSGLQDPRWQALYDDLLARAHQSLTVDPNDPTIKAQTDAASAAANTQRLQQQQAAAERGGAYATGEAANASRTSGETVQIQMAAMSAQLMQREVDARRSEIANALSSMQGILTVDEQSRLKQEDQQLQARSIDLANQQAQFQNQLQSRQLDLNQQQMEWERMFQDRGWNANQAQQIWSNEQSMY